ncbi:hypothetical protein LINGRAHAP2_LOCUS20583 [Linum grandiflorum]
MENGRDFDVDLEAGQNNDRTASELVEDGSNSDSNNNSDQTTSCSSDHSEEKQKQQQQKKKKKNSSSSSSLHKKSPKPPRPPSGPSLDAADIKLINEISKLAMIKRARIQRIKALKKRAKAAKSSSFSNGNLFSILLTVLFFLVIICQGMSSRTTSKYRQTAPEPASIRMDGDVISVHYTGNSLAHKYAYTYLSLLFNQSR